MQKYQEKRPWGDYVRFTKEEPSTVKVLTVESGQAFSLQLHHKRSEYWYVLEGLPSITIGDKVKDAKAGDEFFFEPETKHRIEAKNGRTRVLEISFGQFDEADIVRFEDKYGRAEKK